MTKYHVRHHSISEEAGVKKLPAPEDAEYPNSVYKLFLFFAFYLVAPLIEVPLLGLSLSAPILFLVALPIFFRAPYPWIADYRSWVAIVAAIWFGIFFSATMNGLFSGGTQIDSGSLTSLIRFAYWFLAFVVTLYLASSQNGFAARLVNVIAIGIAFLGFARLGEAVFGGAIGAWTQLRIMTQNSYGIQFSTFYPFLLSLVLWGKHRKLAIIATLALLAAIIINGSRTSWGTVLIGTFVFLWIYLQAGGRNTRVTLILFFLVGILALGSLLAPKTVISSFEQRFSSFDKLETDKSYLIRQLMIQKGLSLFKTNPWIGVGISRWRKESIPLELPRILQYESQSYFDRKSSHNSYISFLAENGLMGTIPYALLLIILTFRGYKAAVSLSKQGEIWAIGVYAGFIGMSVHLWTLSGLTGTAPWFIYGLVAAIIILAGQTATVPPSKKTHESWLSLPRSR